MQVPHVKNERVFFYSQIKNKIKIKVFVTNMSEENY